MNREHVVQLLEMLGAEKITESSEWVRASCLFAPWTHGRGTDSRPSFGISIGRQSHYYCFSCQRSGPLTTLVSSLCMLRRKDNVNAREFVMQHEHLGLEPYEDLEKTPEPLSILAPAVLTQFPPAHMGLEFVQRRGLTQEAIDRFQLRYDPTEARLILPVFDGKGRLVGIRGRATGESSVKYKEYTKLYPNKTSPKAHGIWFGMQFKEPGKRILLVEGEIDAIRLWQKLKRGGIWASMGASLSDEQVKTVQGARESVVMFFDGDEAGNIATGRLQRKLEKVVQGVYRVRSYYHCKDPDELIEKGLLKKALQSIEFVS